MNPKKEESPATAQKPKQAKEYRNFEQVGRRVGSARAQVIITKFIDYECPFCKTFSKTLHDVSDELETRHPGKVAKGSAVRIRPVLRAQCKVSVTKTLLAMI